MLPFGLAVGVAVAVVLCAGVIVLLIILGMRRYGVSLPSIKPSPAHSGPAGEGPGEMEWDNSALNITVNPLDAECAYEEDDMYTSRLQPAPESGDVTADCSEKEEEEEEVEARPKYADVKELEWDDSTLSY